MIARWQEQVGPDDEVWALGDFFFCGASQAKNIMNQLPGKIHFVYGNHDKAIRTAPDLQRKFASLQEYKEVVLGGHTFILFHYPIQEWDKMHRGAIHLYGHIHQKSSGVPGRTLNVCIDSPDLHTGVPYSLFSLEEVVNMALRIEPRPHHGKIIP